MRHVLWMLLIPLIAGCTNPDPSQKETTDAHRAPAVSFESSAADPEPPRGKRSQKSVREFRGRVVRCHDGDTCTVEVGTKKRRIRISGVDSPELKQTSGPDARDFTIRLVAGKEVTLLCDGKSGQRDTCQMRTPEFDLGTELVKAGWAWDSPRYSKRKYRDLQEQARRNRIGLWAKDRPISPYCFRHPKNKCKLDPSYMP